MTNRGSSIYINKPRTQPTRRLNKFVHQLRSLTLHAKSSIPDRSACGMKFLFEFVSCCGSPRKEGERIRAAAAPAPEDEEEKRRRWTGRRGAAAEWKPSLCAISEDVGVVTVGRVGGGGGGERKKKAVDPAPEPERSASRERSGGSYTRVHDRVFNGDEYDQRRASIQAVIPAFSPAPFMF